MKLYKSNSGRWFGRQDDARKAVGNHKFGEVEVPTDKWGLIDWLNANAEKTERLEAPTMSLEEALATQRAAVEPQTALERGVAAHKAIFEQAAHNINVEEEIGRADARTAQRLMEHCVARLVEHIEGRA